jgi:hypothetical protein
MTTFSQAKACGYEKTGGQCPPYRIRKLKAHSPKLIADS